MYRLFQFAQQKKIIHFYASSCLRVLYWYVLFGLCCRWPRTGTKHSFSIHIGRHRNRKCLLHVAQPGPRELRSEVVSNWQTKRNKMKLTKKNNLKNVNIVGEKMMSLAHVFFLFTARKVFDHDFCQFFLAAWYAVRRPIIFPFPHVGDEIARVLPTSWISCVTSS